MYRELGDIVQDAFSREQNLDIESNRKMWKCLKALNQDYVLKEGLNKQLKFGRTIYIPYNKLLVISGDNVDTQNKGPIRDTFVFHLTTQTIERMPNINMARTSFAAHYDFGDQYVYVIGGSNYQEKMVTDCEKFDVYN